jgi:predicted nucleic acid-binding protein
VTLVDTSVILDIVTDDPQWRRWSQFSLDVAALAGPQIINGFVYAELSVRYGSMKELDTLLVEMGFRMESVSRAGLFLAAKVHRQYRSRGGTRSGACRTSSSVPTPQSGFIVPD